MTEEKIEEPTEEEQLINKTNQAAERMENANQELARLLAEQKEMKAETNLGGSADAGTPDISQEDKEINEAKKLLAGTGMEDYVFPDKQ